MIDILLWLFLAFLMPFLGIVAGAHYELWLNKKRQRMPSVFDHGSRQ